MLNMRQIHYVQTAGGLLITASYRRYYAANSLCARRAAGGLLIAASYRGYCFPRLITSVMTIKDLGECSNGG